VSASANVRAQDDNGDRFGTYLSAHVAAGQHDLGDAGRLYRSSLDDNPGDPDIANRAFLYTAASGDVDKSISIAKTVVKADPNDRAARLALAIGALKHGDYSDARAQLSQSGKGPFTTLTLMIVDGWAAQGAGDTDAALKDMDALGPLGGTPALVTYHKALILDLAGRDADADAAYKLLMEQSHNGPRASEA
jgi:Flp pilus assembly protein TadD